MILQSMDFLELARRYDCTLQVGGSDQWGNITGGMDLVRRVLRKDCFAFTVPLVTQSDGTKFGKTESGTVWLDAAKTSPYSFYQFWLNTADADVVNFLKVFSFVELEEIDALAIEVAEQPQQRAAQRRLAEAVTGLVHDPGGLASAQRISSALFGGDIRSLTESDLEQLRQDGISCTAITDNGLLAVLAESPLAQSRSAARKLVESKGIRVNDSLIEAADAILEPGAALHGRYHLIRRGKKAWHLAVHA
jgi:tyrosyl-tRNA synthetase